MDHDFCYDPDRGIRPLPAGFYDVADSEDEETAITRMEQTLNVAKRSLTLATRIMQSMRARYVRSKAKAKKITELPPKIYKTIRKKKKRPSAVKMYKMK